MKFTTSGLNKCGKTIEQFRLGLKGVAAILNSEVAANLG